MVKSLPDFDDLRLATRAQLDAMKLAESHGVACGLLCRDPASGADDFVMLLATLELLERPGSETRAALAGLFEASRSQLDDPQYRFELCLPPDAEPLEERTEAMAQWCSGLLAGLGAGADQPFESASEEVTEALADVAQIARAEVGPGEGGEDEERALAEIVEYLRVVTLVLREELRPAGPDQSVH